MFPSVGAEPRGEWNLDVGKRRISENAVGAGNRVSKEMGAGDLEPISSVSGLRSKCKVEMIVIFE